MILGVTNPFFAKTLQHWPHIIRIGEMGGFGMLVFRHLYSVEGDTKEDIPPKL